MSKQKLIYASTSLLIFVLVLISVLGQTPVIDSAISQGVAKMWSPAINNIFVFFGNFLKPILIILGVFIIFALYNQKRKKESIVLSAALILGYVLENLINIIVQRERPLMQLLEKIGYSFPSGHAVFAAALFSLTIYFYKDEIKNKFQKSLFILTNIILILFVGFSRIYLNVHWFTDVVGGLFLGFFTASIVVIAMEKYGKILTKYL